MPEVRDRALRHAAEHIAALPAPTAADFNWTAIEADYERMAGAVNHKLPPDYLERIQRLSKLYFWLGAEAEGLPEGWGGQ